jgi:hypothetical protein
MASCPRCEFTTAVYRATRSKLEGGIRPMRHGDEQYRSIRLAESLAFPFANGPLLTSPLKQKAAFLAVFGSRPWSVDAQERCARSL